MFVSTCRSVHLSPMSDYQREKRKTVSTTPNPLLCTGTDFRWGSPEYLGLGFLSFVTIIIVEIFGSPFMRNASIIIGLIVGMVVAGATGYVDTTTIKTSPAITFLWVKRFKLSVYGPAILPSLAVYVVLAMEAIGDITASADLSRVEVDGVSRCAHLIFDTPKHTLIGSPNSILVFKEVSSLMEWPGSSPLCSLSRL